MSTNEPRTVWVLGSGFSQPLGGPTLKGLLSASAWKVIQKHHGGKRVARERVWAAVRLYHYGRNYEEGRPCTWDNDRQGELLWQDAEDFLDTLDAATAGGGPKAEVLWDIVTKELHARDLPKLEVHSLEEVAADARRLVAVQCEMFTRQADTKSERWQAHTRWARALNGSGGSHCIITFNYDRVLEKLNFEAALPNQFDPEHGHQVFMLHGSVGWARDASVDPVRYRRQPEGFVANCDDIELAIAAPGPSKQETVRGYEGLWKAAADELSRADAIVFVGYRFPPTDAEARERLLLAIRGNKRPRLALHVVLGPKTNHEDVARLGALLEYTARRAGRQSIRITHGAGGVGNEYSLTVHPLYSQDFLGLWNPELTTLPRKAR